MDLFFIRPVIEEDEDTEAGGPELSWVQQNLGLRTVGYKTKPVNCLKGRTDRCLMLSFGCSVKNTK